MPPCLICLDSLKSPVSLPCGHLFCQECITRSINSSQPFSTQQRCPACRSCYSISNIDPALVPETLRQHILPAIRKVYLEQPSSTDPPDQFALLKSENDTLNVLCNMWRGRSEAHAAATVGLLNMAHTMKDRFIQVKTERDELEKQYNMLKSKVEEPDAGFASMYAADNTTCPRPSFPPR